MEIMEDYEAIFLSPNIESPKSLGYTSFFFQGSRFITGQKFVG